jgi:hypothetical protein
MIDDKAHAVQGTKGFIWMESEMVEKLGLEKDIDLSYFATLVDEAVDALDKYGDVEQFISDGDNDDYVNRLINREGDCLESAV